MERINNLKILKDRRKELRQKETSQEKVLWWHLKARRFKYKFKRQHSIGGYILDFYCADKKLAIELDGEVHNTKESQEYDSLRDSFLKETGCKVLRFSNKELDSNISKVLTEIKNSLEG